MRKWIALAVLACMALGLGGCATTSFVPAQEEREIVLPTPVPESAEAPTGDNRADFSRLATLYYLSADRTALLPVARTLWVSGSQTLVECVMEQLLLRPVGTDGDAIAPDGVRLISASVNGSVATVNLSNEALAATEQEMVWMCAAIARTLTALEGIEYVKLLIGGHVESIGMLPNGLMGTNDGNLTAIWAQAQAEEQRFTEGNADRYLERTVELYFPSQYNDKVLCEVRSVRFTSDNYVRALLSELARGPRAEAEASELIPEGLNPLAEEPTLITSADGRKLIVLPLSGAFMEQIQSLGISQRQFYGAVTLTLCGFVPEVDGLTVRVDGKQITSMTEGDAQYTFRGGIMTPVDFSGMIGDVATIYLPEAESGLLRAARRVMNEGDSIEPRALLEAIFEGPREQETDLIAAAPEGISSADILGVRVEESRVVLNLSSNFYRCCQSLDALQERNLVYAMVNTLTELEGINSVHFYVEGEPLDTFTRDIYLRGDLMRNPGIISK